MPLLSHRRAEDIRQEHAHAIGAREELVDPQPGEQIGRDRGPILFLHGIQPVIEKVGGGALDRFAGAAAKAVIGKAGAGDARQLIAHVPAVGRGTAGIRHRGQVAVEVVRLGIRSEYQLLIVRIVAGRGEHRRQARSSEGP